MKIKVYIERQNIEMEIDIKKGSKVIDLLKTLKIDTTTVLVARNESLITENEFLNDNDNLKLLSVISGG